MDNTTVSIIMDESDETVDEFVGPTIFERIIKLFPTNSIFTTFIFGVIAGPLGNFLFNYLLTRDFFYSLYGLVWFPYSGESNSHTSIISIDLLISNVLWYCLFIYLAFSILFLRKRLLSLEAVLTSLCVDGRDALLDSFGSVSKFYPQLLLALGFVWIYGSSIPGLISSGTLIAINAPIYVIRSLIRSTIFASFFWLYMSSLWGLYQFGKNKLILKSYHIDNYLGLGDLGSLSFYYSRIYLVGLGIYIAHVFFGNKSGYSASINSPFLFILPLIGLTFFFLPLLRIREKMITCKKNEMDKIRIQYGGEIINNNEPFNEISQLNRLLTIESLERKVAAIPTWPFEIPMVGKLAIISLSVTSMIIANYALAFLRSYNLL